MADETIWKLDITPGNSQSILKSFENSLNSVKDRMVQVGQSGQNFEKLSSFQQKAAEAAKKLEVAQASAALALKKAEDAASGGKVSAEQLALAQARAGLAAQKVETAQNNLSVAMNKVQAEGQRLATAMSEDSETTNIFARAAEMAKGALSSLSSGMSSAISHMGELSSKSESSGGGFLNLASKVGMATMGFSNIVGWAKSAGEALLEPIASAESLGISFTTLMGSSKAAANEIKELNHFADVTPFEPQPVQEYAAQLIGMGIDAKQTIPIMTSLGDALFGIGHGTEAEMKSVVDQIGKVRVAGVMTWGDISQLQTHGIDALGAMSLATGKTKESLRDLAGSGGIPAKDAIDALTKGIEMNPLYQGGMAKQSASLSGVLSTLSGYIKTALNSFLGLKDGMVVTGSILDRVKTAFSGLATIAQSNVFQGFAEGAGKAMGDIFDRIGWAVSYAATALQKVDLTNLSNGWKAFSGEVSYLAGKFGELFDKTSPLGGILQQIGSDFDPIAKAIQGIAQSGVDTVGGFFAGIAFNLAELDNAIENGKGPFADFVGSLQNLSKAVSGELSSELKTLGQDAKQVGDWFNTSVVPALKQAEPGFSSLASAILGMAPVFIQIRSIVVDIIQNAFEKFAPIIEKIVPPLIVLAGIIAGQVSNAIQFLTPYILQAAKAIGDFANDIIDRVAPIITNVINGIKPILENIFHVWGVIWPGMSQVLKGIWEEIVGVLKIAWAIVTGVFKIALDLIAGNWGQVWKDMKDMLGGIWDGIKTFIGGGIDAVKGLFTTIWAGLSDSIGKPFNDAWNTISGIFDNIKGAIAWVTGQAPEVTANTANIMTGPHHFASGIENFGGGLAFVHAKEMLVNLPKGTSVWNPAKTAAFMNSANALKAPSVPSFASSQGSTSASNSNASNEQVVGLLAGILSELQKQGKTSNTTLNASITGGSVDAQKLINDLQSIIGRNYESVSRGAF